MLTSKEQKRAADEISTSTNTIGKGTYLEGNIETHGNIRIEGKITGNIKSKSKVALGNGSQVQGNILAVKAEIEGEVKAKMEIIELLVWKSTAGINGEILTGKMEVRQVAVFMEPGKRGEVIRAI